MKRSTTIFLVLLTGLFLKPYFLLAQSQLDIIKKVADKVIQESSFEFEMVPQKPRLGMQVVDFRQTFGEKIRGTNYAISYIFSENDTTAMFGFSCGDPVKIWLNDRPVYTQKNRMLIGPGEISYNRFVFQDTLLFKLNKGANKILVKTVGRTDNWIFFMRAVTEAGDENEDIGFSLRPIAPAITSSNWLCCGVFPGDDLNDVFPPENEFKNYYAYMGEIFSWISPRHNILLELKIRDTNSFQRDSYLDWHYANGATMFGILALSDATGEKKYRDFVKKYCDFVVANQDYFKWQYEQLHAYRGSFHRIFRRTMLDDTGAPALPFLILFDQTKKREYWDLIGPVANYISNQQVRLKDGTFCRPEPEKYTVWADDLFMSVPFLLRMGKITGEAKYFDDAAHQIVNFTGLLFNRKAKLFYHAWFSQTDKNSIAFWGRANGWVMWATSELLLHLPEKHPRYKKILGIYRKHIEGLVRLQDENGMWHQVLDHPESYEETSCTAMFVLGIARGVQYGWIDRKYKNNAIKGWNALTRKIDDNGTVHSICRGTGIGTDRDFYFKRATFDHDPRGLGAVIIAGVEILKLIDKESGKN